MNLNEHTDNDHITLLQISRNDQIIIRRRCPAYLSPTLYSKQSPTPSLPGDANDHHQDDQGGEDCDDLDGDLDHEHPQGVAHPDQEVVKGRPRSLCSFNAVQSLLKFGKYLLRLGWFSP